MRYFALLVIICILTVSMQSFSQSYDFVEIYKNTNIDSTINSHLDRPHPRIIIIGEDMRSIPDEIFRLNNIYEIRCFSDSLIYISNELFSCESLELLRLFTPHIANEHHFCRRLKELKNLQDLWLKVDTADMSYLISDLQQLHGLGLVAKNKVNYTLPATIADIKNLKGLILENFDCVTLPGNMNQLDNLAYLTISSNRFLKKNMDVINKANLEFLKINCLSTAKDTLDLPDLREFPKLKDVLISNCFITDKTIRLLRDSLKVVFTKCEFSDLSAEELKKSNLEATVEIELERKEIQEYNIINKIYRINSLDGILKPKIRINIEE